MLRVQKAIADKSRKNIRQRQAQHAKKKLNENTLFSRAADKGNHKDLDEMRAADRRMATQIFEKYDTNKDNEIGVDELGKILSDLGIPPTRRNVKKALNQMDEDKSGSVDLDEFLAWWLAEKERLDPLMKVLQEKNKSHSVMRSSKGGKLRKLFNISKYSPKEKIPWHVIPPDSIGKVVWDWVVILFIVFVAVEVPLELSLEWNDIPDYGREGDYVHLQIFSYLTSMVFLVDIFLSLLTAYRAVGDHHLTTSHWRIILRYISFQFWFDLAAAVPWDLVYQPLLLLRLAKLTRLARLMKWFNKVTYRPGHMPVMTDICEMLFLSYIVVHWMTCLWIALLEGENDMVGTKASDLSNWSLYLRSFYWTITTLTTVGYGDVTPVNDSQIVYTLVVQIFGVALYGWAMGTIASGLIHFRRETEEKREQMRVINMYMRHRRLPADVQDNIWDYFQFKWENRLGLEEIGQSVMADVPDSLTNTVNLSAKSDVMNSVEVFRKLKSSTKAMLAQLLTPNVYIPDQPIYSSGDVLESVFFLARGVVELCFMDEIDNPLYVVKEGEPMGHSPVIASIERGVTNGEGSWDRRYFTATARSYCICYSIDRDDFMEIVQQDHELFTTLKENHGTFIKELLRTSELMSHMPPAVLDQLWKGTHLQYVQAGQNVYDLDDDASHVFYVYAGMVAMIKGTSGHKDSEGSERGVETIDEGEGSAEQSAEDDKDKVSGGAQNMAEQSNEGEATAGAGVPVKLAALKGNVNVNASLASFNSAMEDAEESELQVAPRRPLANSSLTHFHEQFGNLDEPEDEGKRMTVSKLQDFTVSPKVVPEPALDAADDDEVPKASPQSSEMPRPEKGPNLFCVTQSSVFGLGEVREGAKRQGRTVAVKNSLLFLFERDEFNALCRKSVEFRGSIDKRHYSRTNQQEPEIIDLLRSMIDGLEEDEVADEETAGRHMEEYLTQHKPNDTQYNAWRPDARALPMKARLESSESGFGMLGPPTGISRRPSISRHRSVAVIGTRSISSRFGAHSARKPVSPAVAPKPRKLNRTASFAGSDRILAARERMQSFGEEPPRRGSVHESLPRGHSKGSIDDEIRGIDSLDSLGLPVETEGAALPLGLSFSANMSRRASHDSLQRTYSANSLRQTHSRPHTPLQPSPLGQDSSPRTLAISNQLPERVGMPPPLPADNEGRLTVKESPGRSSDTPAAGDTANLFSVDSEAPGETDNNNGTATSASQGDQDEASLGNNDPTPGDDLV